MTPDDLLWLLYHVTKGQDIVITHEEMARNFPGPKLSIFRFDRMDKCDTVFRIQVQGEVVAGDVVTVQGELEP